MWDQEHVFVVAVIGYGAAYEAVMATGRTGMSGNISLAQGKHARGLVDP